MAIKTISKEIMTSIMQTLKISSFARPYAGLIDQGDFGTVATYLPLFKNEYDKLPPELQAHAYRIAPGRFGLIAFLPRTFEAPDGGKTIELTRVYNKYRSLKRVLYKTDIGGEFQTEHSIRIDKLLAYAKNKKLPIKDVVDNSL